MSRYGLIELHDLYAFNEPNAHREVVMCKECKWADKCSQNIAILETYDMYEKLDFCSHGEREGE